MPNTRVVELRLRELSQLFDPLDPSSPDERDLHHRVEEFIVESLKEVFSNEVRELVVHFDQPTTMPDEERIVVSAIRAYFAPSEVYEAKSAQAYSSRFDQPSHRLGVPRRIFSHRADARSFDGREHVHDAADGEHDYWWMGGDVEAAGNLSLRLVADSWGTTALR